MVTLKTDIKEKLLAASKQVRLNAYCPYSEFKVGAAILTTDGKIYTGCNVENVSFGLTICAERCATVKMISENGKSSKIKAVAVTTENGCTPYVFKLKKIC